MKASEVRAMNDEELTIELSRLRERLFELRQQSVTDKVSDNSQFRKLRRDVARVLTEQTARRRAAAETAAG